MAVGPGTPEGRKIQGAGDPLSLPLRLAGWNPQRDSAGGRHVD